MKFQLWWLASLLIPTLATPSVHAGPVFTFQAGPPPGPGGAYGNVDYAGLNDFSGVILATSPFYGILGLGTPLNSGRVFSESEVSFAVNGNSGSFDIIGTSNDFIGTVVTSGVSSTGGSFVVDGTLSASAAAFFGLSASTAMVGTATIELGPAPIPNGPANDLGSLQFTFSPSVPEPSSVVLLGTGVLGLIAVLHRRSRRA